ERRRRPAAASAGPLRSTRRRQRSRPGADAPAHADHLQDLAVKPVLCWLDDRLGLSTTFKPLIEHPVPPTGWDYTIGSATLIAFSVQVVTGVALAFTYVPTPDHAYASLDFITNGAILGNVVRGIHFWGASAMVLLVCMHAAQVFLIGAFKFPREVNWLSGTMLLVFTFGMAFTGQLL